MFYQGHTHLVGATDTFDRLEDKYTVGAESYICRTFFSLNWFCPKNLSGLLITFYIVLIFGYEFAEIFEFKLK
jgi:hypothetical protein